MGQIKQLLNRSYIFSSLGESDTQRLEPLFDIREIHPGEILANVKEAVQFFFLLNTGTVLVAMEGGRAVVLNTPGDFIGLELISVKGVCKATVTVLEKGSIYAVPRQDFLAVIQEDSETAAAIMASWQEYLERTAPFAKHIETIDLPEIF